MCLADLSFWPQSILFVPTVRRVLVTLNLGSFYLLSKFIVSVCSSEKLPLTVQCALGGPFVYAL